MLLFTEGWDWSVTAANYTSGNKWLDTSSPTISTTNQRFVSGGNSFNATSRSNFMRRAIGSNLASGIIGFAFRADSSATYLANIIVMFDTTSTVQMGLQLNNDLTISIFRTSNSNILGTSSALSPNTWYYLELKFKISDSISSGDVVLYADGSAICTLAAASDTKNTANAYITHYAFGGNSPSGAGSGRLYWDDHYLADLTGSVNNAPLGSVRIQTLFPDGNGNTSGWVGSDGNSVNNYQQVDDNPYNAADYNDGINSGDKDTYTFGDTDPSTSAIYGITVNMFAEKTDTATRGIKPVVRHSGTDYDGTEDLLTTSFLHYQHVYETNPGTSGAWNKTDLDAAEFGVKVST